MSEAALRRSVVVIGAGVVGILTAFALSKRGIDVLVIDAMSGPAEMCSRANAGIVAVGHARAWAGPQAIATMLRAIGGSEPSVKISRFLVPALWHWGTEFLAHYPPNDEHRNTDKVQRLSRFSRDLIAAAETDMGLPKEARHGLDVSTSSPVPGGTPLHFQSIAL
ncbi:FAD-dependent oxidoreductase [Phyllobacterium endophyticum]|uniref:FAD-dependent oxidoreductase n=1 Tax=Phyllobacterium endophyticum TaxID=1149773 RepID=UPI0011CC55ED|nr:FAD-dependent oxidoreductase [Phyllobacterium endophyticum]TXR50376.1 FAD-dependent oxidoreductase [Phyllobacterium endophyticum]